jgi:hypothetical protein
VSDCDRSKFEAFRQLSPLFNRGARRRHWRRRRSPLAASRRPEKFFPAAALPKHNTAGPPHTKPSSSIHIIDARVCAPLSCHTMASFDDVLAACLSHDNNVSRRLMRMRRSRRARGSTDDFGKARTTCDVCAPLDGAVLAQTGRRITRVSKAKGAATATTATKERERCFGAVSNATALIEPSAA